MHPLPHGMRLWSAILSLVSALTLPSARAADGDVPRPFPTVAAFAARENIPLEGISTAPGTANRAGDAIVGLVSLVEQKATRQWLLLLTTVEMTAEELAMKPPPPETMYTTSGVTVRFESRRQALALRLVGPFHGDARDTKKAPADNRSRALVKADFLALGLNRTAQALIRMKSVEGDLTLDYGISDGPYSEKRIAETRPKVLALGMTPEEEQALAGFPLALMNFFDVAQKAPGLREILFEMLNKMSLLGTLLSHGGKIDPGFSFDSEGVAAMDLSTWSPALTGGYRLPLTVTLNKKPALTCLLTVAAPQPPLLVSAGILELTAVPPGSKPAKRLFIRLVATRRGPEELSKN